MVSAEASVEITVVSAISVVTSVLSVDVSKVELVVVVVSVVSVVSEVSVGVWVGGGDGAALSRVDPWNVVTIWRYLAEIKIFEKERIKINSPTFHSQDISVCLLAGV